MKRIVITGSTRGIGSGLANEFLKRGCSVAISGRSQDSVDRAVSRLSSQYDAKRICGSPCDVTRYSDIKTLWDTAADTFGAVDIWINNAGIPNPVRPYWELSPEDIAATINTDLTGLLFCCRVAIEGMLEQGHGQIYNMEGHGSNGSVRPGLTVYGAAKRAVRYVSRSLQKEVEGKPVGICTLSPGIVITDFITRQKDTYTPEQWERVKKTFNILADKPETVTPWLAEKVLANEESGAHFAWLTRGKAMRRFLTASFNKRDLFADLGL